MGDDVDPEIRRGAQIQPGGALRQTIAARGGPKTPANIGT
eukprot:CAMPEP_0179345738 /NCGR_PEP_ID=MMETSP0797-20121207/72204_1 /TAXON_ID=47934 /ORGANISM="Dinophysis acuminata, Strain DAEP01" /LENGTH=39 /DNA_ID= /DNA_START= /DNA_END= /DNA_ORIENTATION=